MTRTEIKAASQVKEKDHGLRLDTYLAQRFTYLSRNAWQREIKNAKIQINNKTITSPHKKITQGDSVTYSGRELHEPPVDTAISILYEDDYYIAVHKSGDLPVHPGGRYLNNTLTMMLKNDAGCDVFPIHRIDRETSGLILLAKTKEAVSQINKTFSKSTKTYLTIIKGRPEKKSFTIDTPLGKDHHSKIRKKQAAYTDAPETAVTRFRVIRQFKNHTLLSATLVTGRLHQIRAHLESESLPILGDKIYGGNENFYLVFIETGGDEALYNKIGFRRCALHSRSLTFYHPYIKKTVRIVAPLHHDMKECIINRDCSF